MVCCDFYEFFGGLLEHLWSIGSSKAHPGRPTWITQTFKLCYFRFFENVAVAFVFSWFLASGPSVGIFPGAILGHLAAILGYLGASWDSWGHLVPILGLCCLR